MKNYIITEKQMDALRSLSQELSAASDSVDEESEFEIQEISLKLSDLQFKIAQYQEIAAEKLYEKQKF